MGKTFKDSLRRARGGGGRTQTGAGYHQEDDGYAEKKGWIRNPRIRRSWDEDEAWDAVIPEEDETLSTGNEDEDVESTEDSE